MLIVRWLCVLLLGAAGLVAASATPALAASSCTVAYSVVNNWPGGFQASITITNNAAALSGWTLAFTFPNDQAVSNGWGGTFTQDGQNLSVASASYDGALATGGSTTIGFVGTVGATNSEPAYFTINGYACNGATQVPSVAITSPAAGASFTPGSAVTITATASEPTASIAKVEFFGRAPSTPAFRATASSTGPPTRRRSPR
jgi:hypothetical protein